MRKREWGWKRNRRARKRIERVEDQKVEFEKNSRKDDESGEEK